MKNSFKIGDLLAIGGVLLAAALVLLVYLPRGNTEAAVAQIYQNGKLVMTLPLDQPRELPVTGGYCNTITVRDGKIAITGSDCPGQDCVHSGWLDSPGRSLVCLPNALEIRVVAEQSEVDFVVG